MNLNSPDLAGLKARLRERIDTEAEGVRRLYITAGDGQAMVYLQKRAEAEVVAAGGEPGPHIAAEIGITGTTAAEVAAVILAQAQAWAAVSAGIESRRLGAKAAVDAAATIPAALQAGRVNWSDLTP